MIYADLLEIEADGGDWECEHVLSSIFLTSISVVGSHCKVSAMSAGHMRHAELSLNSTM
jgi:hypothetical protein